jgi:hypothetical protein
MLRKGEFSQDDEVGGLMKYVGALHAALAHKSRWLLQGGS